MNGIDDAIHQLEGQKAAIEKALAALHELDGNERAHGAQTAAGSANSKRSLAQKRRWAAKHAAEPVPALAKTARSGGISAAGRKALAEAMKRRWAAKRTAAQAKKRGAKKAA